eukprot:2862645-Rhodomonas_salina.5
MVSCKVFLILRGCPGYLDGPARVPSGLVTGTCRRYFQTNEPEMKVWPDCATVSDDDVPFHKDGVPIVHAISVASPLSPTRVLCAVRVLSRSAPTPHVVCGVGTDRGSVQAFASQPPKSTTSNHNLGTVSPGAHVDFVVYHEPGLLAQLKSGLLIIGDPANKHIQVPKSRHLVPSALTAVLLFTVTLHPCH